MSDHVATQVSEPISAASVADRPARAPLMTPAEWRRRILHIAPGFLPLVLWYIFHHDPLSWDSRAWMALIIVSIGAGTAIRYRQIARRGETMNAACILGYAVPVFLLLMLLPSHAEIGLAVLAVIAIGDGSATLAGLLMRGPRLPWNPDKSWAGLLTFMLLGSTWASIIYWGEARPVVPISSAFLIGGTAAIVAGICESLNSRIDDNIRVGVAASVCVVVTHGILIGF